MEFHWIRREGNSRLLLFVLGWAADHCCVEHVVPAGCDAAAIYDYRDMALADRSFMDGYDKVVLLAWSFGVWVAEQLFRGDEFSRRVALGGTPLPLDERYGLAPRRAAVTLQGIRLKGTGSFNRAAYGEYYDRLAGVLSPRGLEADIDELEHLITVSAEPYTPHLDWDRAIVGDRDTIFRPENMTAYWRERAEVLPLPHYPFGDGKLISGIVGCE